MLKTFKTEIDPTPEQKVKIRETIGVCRYVYNFFIAHNKELYKSGEKFINGKLFSVWLNNEYIPNNPDKSWIKEVSSKAVKKSIENANTAFMRFFDHKTNFPRFKKKSRSNVKMYFVKNNAGDCRCERHRINIPTLKWIKLKEKGYIPTTKDGYIVRSGTISIEAGKYYLSALVDVPETKKETNYLLNNGIGIDLGVKEFATCSNGKIFKNINKSKKIKKLKKKLKREQRRLSRKYEFKKKRGEETATYYSANIEKQKIKIQRIHQRINNIRTDYVNKTIAELAKNKPAFITIEDLNVSGMMKNRHLAKAVQEQKFYEFRTKLMSKCNEFGIELRIVDRFYPSSKTCNCCGYIKKDLKLSDRTYICPSCGYIEDRDLNAAMNLRDAETYKIA